MVSGGSSLLLSGFGGSTVPFFPAVTQPVVASNNGSNNSGNLFVSLCILKPPVFLAAVFFDFRKVLCVAVEMGDVRVFFSVFFPEFLRRVLFLPPQPEQDKNCLVVNYSGLTEQQLQRLEGIGPVLAQRIVEYRQEVNGFTVVEELLLVEGIGETTLENIREFIIIGEMK